MSPIVNTTAGKAFINSTATWIDAVHAQKPPPLSIFTRIFFSNARQPEIGPKSPFAQVASSLGTSNDSNTFIYPAFRVNEAAGDVVLQKTRYYAGAGNGLEEILRAQQIDTVVLSGIRTSGVILNTAYQLFNLDYKVYVIANNTIETPPSGPGVNSAILEGVIPKLPADVITLEQALAALKRSGPAVY
ncbi:Putative isochorismatase [Septoria linicola]|uniref:Isochorismatase n=1 Tax=Septoria linicola TaxID=215465 RepID=A0A9Q9EN25_9PEZI|nr:putative isochorismatase [Septoria linicola]USW57346.1 Putative isochorismatase [Septoria linicola]